MRSFDALRGAGAPLLAAALLLTPISSSAGPPVATDDAVVIGLAGTGGAAAAPLLLGVVIGATTCHSCGDLASGTGMLAGIGVGSLAAPFLAAWAAQAYGEKVGVRGSYGSALLGAVPGLLLGGGIAAAGAKTGNMAVVWAGVATSFVAQGAGAAIGTILSAKPAGAASRPTRRAPTLIDISGGLASPRVRLPAVSAGITAQGRLQIHLPILGAAY